MHVNGTGVSSPKPSPPEEEDLARKTRPLKGRATALEVLPLDDEKTQETTESVVSVNGDGSIRKLSDSEPPPLPQAPTDCFARDEIMSWVLDHLDNFTSVVLSGAVGIGKNTIALTILHHDRVKAKFSNRYFMCCNGLANSLESFLMGLSDAIGFPSARSIEELRPHLVPRPPLLLVLDAVDCILDPPAGESGKISTIIEEICQYQNVCILATSRMAVSIPGLRSTEVPTLSGHGGHDIFYTLCHLNRSSAIDSLIGILDFHPLSIALLARAACEKSWDEPRLQREWDDDRTGVLNFDNNQGLATAIESVLAAPTIQKLGPPAHRILEAIAVFPEGMEERRFGRMFSTIDGVGEVINVLCRFYLVERYDGSVRMLSPFRFHFRQQTPMTLHVRHNGGNDDDPAVEEEEDIRCDNARAGPSPDLLAVLATGLTGTL